MTEPPERHATDAPGGEVILLMPKMDLTYAPSLRDRLVDVTGDCTLDASAVEVVTSPVLQVLMAAGDRARARGSRLAIRNPSQAFIACLTILGVTIARIEHELDSSNTEVEAA